MTTAASPQSQYEGIISIEEPVIKVIEAAVKSRSLTPFQMSLLARAGAADFGYSLTWAQILEPYATNGVPTEPEKLLEWEVTRDLFYETFPAEFAAFTKSFDNEPTKFLHLHAMFVERGDPLYWMISKDLLVCQLLEAGKFGFVTGDPGFGKSDYCFGGIIEPLCSLWEDHVAFGSKSRLSRIVRSMGDRAAKDPLEEREREPDVDAGLPQLKRMGMAGAKDFRILTNTQFGNDHPYAKYCRFTPALSDYHIGADEAYLDGAYHVEIMDEYGAAEKRGTQNQTKRFLESYARRVRKNNGSLVYTSQDDGDLTDWIAKWLDTRIQMLDDHAMLITIAHTPYTMRKVLGVWRTTMPYNTGSRSPVIPDVDEDDYMVFMGEIERSIGFDNPEANLREMHEASIRWVKEHRNWEVVRAARAASEEADEAAESSPRKRARAG